MGEPRVKGVAIRGILASLERLLPPGTVDELAPYLPKTIAGKVKHRTFISSSWYPLAEYRALLEAIMRVTGRDVEVIEQLSREATINDFRGVYRLLTFVLSPQFVIQRAGGVFQRYYDSGTLTVPVARRGYAEAQFRGCLGFDRVLWKDAAAGAMGVLDACGARGVRIRWLRGGNDGEVDCDLIAEWS